MVDTSASIHVCHSLHVALLLLVDREAEAKEVLAAIKDDGAPKRDTNLKEFVKHVKLDEIGKALVDSWVARPEELVKRY
jgi:hypothetical protein